MKYLVIGNGIAGSTAAKKLRENERDSSITVLTDESRPLYNRILLKTYMKGDLPLNAAKIHGRDWYEERDIELCLNTRVEKVNRSEKNVVSESGEKFNYDKLLVATGGSPRKLPQDDDYDNVHYMWDWEDARKIAESAENSNQVAVVGGGLLGIDLAVAFAERGCDVNYLVRSDHWFHRALDPKPAEMVHEALEHKGIHVMTDTEVVDLKATNNAVEEITTQKGDNISVQHVGVAIGQKPNTGFIDLDKNGKNQIKTDPTLRTSDPDIYAAGDQVSYESPKLGRVTFGSWGHSEAMGRCAAYNMCGGEREFTSVNTYGVSHFDFPIRVVGSFQGEYELVETDGGYRQVFRDQGRKIGLVSIGPHNKKRVIEDSLDI